MILQRRKFLTGLGALMAAPAIVSFSNIMPVKALPFQLEQFDPVYLRTNGFEVFVRNQKVESILEAVKSAPLTKSRPLSQLEIAEDARMFGDLRADIMQAWVTV